MSGYRAALTANLGNGWALFGVRSSLIPLFVTEGIGASGTWIGIGFFVSAAAQGGLLLWAGGFADRVGRRPAMILGSAVAMASMAAVAVSDSLLVYTVAMALFGAGSAFLSVAPSAAVGDVASGRGGTVVAAFQMTADLGAVIGPLAAGWLADELLVRRRVRRHRRRCSPRGWSLPCSRRRRGTAKSRRHPSRRRGRPPDRRPDASPDRDRALLITSVAGSKVRPTQPASRTGRPRMDAPETVTGPPPDELLRCWRWPTGATRA